MRVLQVRPAVDAWLGDAPAIDAIVHAAGFMRTGLIGALDLREGEAMWRLHVAAAAAPSADRTFIKPEEVAAVVRFLLSAQAAAITGQNIVICGRSSL